jgi:hypothetical protein
VFYEIISLLVWRLNKSVKIRQLTVVEDALAWLPLVAGALPRAPRPAGEKEETGGKKITRKI